jgi:hypothetical protein
MSFKNYFIIVLNIVLTFFIFSISFAEAEKISLEIYALWKAESIIAMQAAPLEGKDPIVMLEKIDSDFSKYYGDEWDEFEDRIKNDRELRQELNKIVMKILREKGYEFLIVDNSEVILSPVSPEQNIQHNNEN